MYAPWSEAVRQRAYNEAAEDKKSRWRDVLYNMQIEIWNTLDFMADHRSKQLSSKVLERFQVGLTTDFTHYVQLIRADDVMLLGFYLSARSGTSTPTMQVRGVSSEYFTYVLPTVRDHVEVRHETYQ